jgi:hypothetical protein
MELRFWMPLMVAGLLMPVPALAEKIVVIGEIREGVSLSAEKTAAGWGIRISAAGMASAWQPTPVELELYEPEHETGSEIRYLAAAYESVTAADGAVVGHVTLTPVEGVRLTVADRWQVRDSVVTIRREVQVEGSAAGGFLSAVTFPVDQRLTWPEVEWFAPGMMYGDADGLPRYAIGAAHQYRAGAYDVRIREDRLSATVFGGRFADGTSLSVLNSAPSGETTLEDAMDRAGVTLVDARFEFGALGAQERGQRLAIGYWYPGTEGQVIYADRRTDEPQWRGRYHPLSDGQAQHHEVMFRVGRHGGFAEFMRDTWRWTWGEMQPEPAPQDIPLVRRALVDMMSERVIIDGPRTGMPNAVNMRDRRQYLHTSVLGFCGSAVDAATILIYEGNRDDGPRGERLRQRGEAIIASLLTLEIAPPAGEGIHLATGEPILAFAQTGEVFLRSFGDDLKHLVECYLREKEDGREHPEWLGWARGFADWLLTQQQPEGGFPRAWTPVSGEAAQDSAQSTFNAVPLLVLMSQATGDENYLRAAIRAGDFMWANGHNRAQFVGGTIDNPNVLDKEAGSLSLEAYLSLYEATGEPKWLHRAELAAAYAASWIYLWNVPMPEGHDDQTALWTRGVCTVGMQLIATGHSGADGFMAYSVGHYAKLYRHTQDEHYLDVARVLLHGTKGMTGIPGRTFNLPGPGWQQEHWTFAPPRGHVGVFHWLPWVSSSHLRGIIRTEQLDPQLLERISQ